MVLFTLILAKPKAVEWRNKPMLFYDKLARLFGNNWATQENGDTVRAKRATRNNYIETTEEIDHFVENGIWSWWGSSSQQFSQENFS